MHNTAMSQDHSLKIEPRRMFMRKISGHSRKQRFPFLILLNLSEVRINQILGRSDFSLRKFDLFSLVSLQTMIGMGMVIVKREADKNLGDNKNISWFIAWPVKPISTSPWCWLGNANGALVRSHGPCEVRGRQNRTSHRGHCYPCPRTLADKGTGITPWPAPQSIGPHGELAAPTILGDTKGRGISKEDQWLARL